MLRWLKGKKGKQLARMAQVMNYYWLSQLSQAFDMLDKKKLLSKLQDLLGTGFVYRLFGMAWVFDGLPSGYKDGGTLLDIAPEGLHILNRVQLSNMEKDMDCAAGWYQLASDDDTLSDARKCECGKVESPGYLEPEIFHSDQEQTALVEHQVDSPVYLEPEIFNSDQEQTALVVEGDETTATGASASTASRHIERCWVNCLQMTVRNKLMQLGNQMPNKKRWDTGLSAGGETEDRKPRMTQDLPEQDDQKLEKKQGPLDPEDRIPEKEEVHRQGQIREAPYQDTQGPGHGQDVQPKQGAFSLGIWNRKGIEDEVKVVKGCSQRKPLQGGCISWASVAPSMDRSYSQHYLVGGTAMTGMNISPIFILKMSQLCNRECSEC
ncbi:cnnm4 [Symbiodinium microadriaticum]|nr:cnnm4 [Symbiodinium microadriaticum]